MLATPYSDLATSVLRWRVLGPFEVAAFGRPVDLGGPQLRGVLAHLVAASGRTVSVGALAAELWGHSAPDDAYRTVRTYVSRLRATLRRAVVTGVDDLLVTSAPGYQLRVDPDSVDATRFEELFAQGRQAMQARQPRVAVQRFTAALGMWRGDAYAGLEERPAISAESTRLNELRLAAVEARIDATLATGFDARLVGELEGLVRHHPTRERLWGHLMTALYHSGRQADALAAFRTVRTMLIEDYGVEPSPRLVEIHRQVLQHDLVFPDRATVSR